ncbi:MAG: hypothetical protein PHQ54_05695, partial [Candidatus Omnitrophica bacterium]|nr:hypothetical protein [Candidatus Omnitrophota bacterium]
MIKLRNKAISIITFIIFFISSQYPYTISIFGSSKAEILRRSRAGYSLVSDDLRSFLDSLSPFDSLGLSEALNQRDIEQDLAARAIEIEGSIVRAFGWGSLSNEDQAVLIWMAQELIEAALTFNVQRSGYGQAVSDVATPVLGEIISNIDGIVSSLEELCGQALDINDPAAFLVISPWLIIAMKYQLDNGCLVSETIDYMQDLIGKVKETGLDFNLTDSYEVGEVVAYVNVLSVADTLGTGYEGLAANVLLWSSIYRVSQDYVLSLAQGAIEHKAIVEAALSDIGKSSGHESVVPWLNAAMDRAIREDTSIEAAMNDMAVIIRFMQ